MDDHFQEWPSQKSPPYFCSFNVKVKTKQNKTKPKLFICFSKSRFWLVCLLSNYYCVAVTQAQFIEWNAVNFLLALGGYGLFFLLLGANFFLLPSLTSCLGAWLYREAAEVSVRSHWLDFCYPSPRALPPMHHCKLPDHIHFRLGVCQRHGLCFLMRIWRGQRRERDAF